MRERERMSSAAADAAAAAEGKGDKWIPLESNPDIMNTYTQRLGLEGGFAFTDVFGTDPDLLAFVPQVREGEKRRRGRERERERERKTQEDRKGGGGREREKQG